MSEFTIREATRVGVRALVGMFGKSGGGKTRSALIFARGMVGPSGRIVGIDSESGRMSIFADVVPGGFRVIDIEPPFSPDRYQAAFEVAEANSDVVVMDSLTHEHNGEGGVLDMQEAELDRMAGQDWKKREACKMAAWIKPKLAHKKFVQRLLRSKVPVICCLRGEEKTHMLLEDGKKKVVTDQFSTPLFDPRFIFEMLLNFEVVERGGKGGYIIPRKITHPDIETLIPREGEQISAAHGAALAKWCSATSSAPPSDPLKACKARLWDACKPFRGIEKNTIQIESQLRKWAILQPGERIADLTTVEQFQDVIDKVEIQLQPA